MRILIPRSDSYSLVRLIAFTPKGEVNMTVSSDRHRWVDLELPFGVQEDEVDLYSCFLGEDHRPPYGCGPALLRAATRKSDLAVAADVAADLAPAADAAPTAVVANDPAPTADIATDPAPVADVAGDPAADVAVDSASAATVPAADAATDATPAADPAPAADAAVTPDNNAA